MESNVQAELVTDAAGLTMELIRRKNGRYIAPDMVLETVEKLPNVPLRDDDVMLCSYPKSGCHWMWETIRILLLGETDEHTKCDKEAYMVELNSMENLNGLNSPRVLNNHDFFEEQPKDLLKKNVKTVFIYRNIKDVAVSYYHHHTRDPVYKYQGTFSQYLQRFTAGLVDSGGVFEYMKSWEDGIKANPGMYIHILSYENMSEEPMKELRRLNDFLGAGRDEEFLKMVYRETSLQAMKNRKDKVTEFRDSNGEPIMYRKGKVGDWQNHFSSSDREAMDDKIAKELGTSTLFVFRDQLSPNPSQ